MKTESPISTIHYLQPEILKVKLDGLVSRDKISFYAFIKHLKEDDETKDHIHLYVIPNGRIDTDQLRTELEEIDLTNVKPIRPLPFSKTKRFADWYLYILHDGAYLMQKNQTRKYSYRHEEILTSNGDYLNELVHQIDYTNYRRQQQIVDMASKKVPFDEVVSHGLIPVQQFIQYQKLYEMVYQRAMRTNQTHDNVDNETGEVMENGEEVPW